VRLEENILQLMNKKEIMKLKLDSTLVELGSLCSTNPPKTNHLIYTRDSQPQFQMSPLNSKDNIKVWGGRLRHFLDHILYDIML
jgi:hypothetical protein